MVNAAGLKAHALSNTLARTLGRPERPLYLAKGSYFSLQGRSPFSRLIYPVPEPGGLGVHLTLDLAGQARFGPDVEWVEREDFAVDPARAAGFYAAIRGYWPGLSDGALAPAYAGIRPKLTPPGTPAADFHVEAHAVGGSLMIDLLGVESPGLTASLALGRYVADLADARLPA